MPHPVVLAESLPARRCSLRYGDAERESLCRVYKLAHRSRARSIKSGSHFHMPCEEDLRSFFGDRFILSWFRSRLLSRLSFLLCCQEYEPPPMEPSELFASLFGGAGSTQ